MAKISVIVPVYKVEPYLHRCVDSILAQTFSDFELILVDDGSPDNCPVICDEYAQKDSRVVVIHKKNGGLSSARNAGLDWAMANSQSQWIAFVDSDDWVHSLYLEKLYAAVTEENVQVSICLYAETYGDHPPFQEPLSPEGTTLNRQQLQELSLQVKDVAVVAWNKLYQKELFAKIRYPLGKLHEDEFTTHRILWGAEKGVLLQDVLYYYFQRSDSIMGRPFTAANLDANEAFQEQIRFYFDNRFIDIAQMYSLQQEEELAALIQTHSSKEGDRLILKRSRQLYRQLVKISKPLWPRKFWLERCLFAISPKLMNGFFRLYNGMKRKK